MVTDTLILDVTLPLLAVSQFPVKNSPPKFTPVKLAYHLIRGQHLTDILILLANFNSKDIYVDYNKTIVCF